MERVGEFGVSKRGKDTFVFNGYKYCKHYVNKHGHVTWRCCESRSLRCKGSVVSDGLCILRNENAFHNHERNTLKVSTRKAVNDMQKNFIDTCEGPIEMQGMVASTHPPDVLVAVPEGTTLGHMFQGHWKNS